MAWVLSVDFGTSSTAAAMGRDGGAQLVGVDGGLPRMLSNVFWHDSRGQLLLGDVADNASATMPWCYEPCPKRKLGQEFLLLGDERVRVSDAVGAILQSVAQDATRMQGGERHKAVRLTHPVRWGTERRNALIEAAAVAGLDEPELVLEPVAAAMHYASERLQPGEHVAVYDLGGGTFDTAVLQRTDTGFQVVGVPGGRNGFGGEEFDDGVYRFLGAQLPEEDWLRLRSKPETDDDTAWPKANRHFQRNVRRAKELLTKTSQVDVLVPSPVNRELVLRTDDLNALIRTDVEDSVAELERTIRSAGLEPEQLAAIYLAGGSSQIPLVTSTITERLGIAPTYLNDPKAVICLGAALGFRQAAKNGAHASRTDGGAAAAAIGSSTAAAAIESSTAAAAIESSTAAAAIESSRAPSAVATAVDLADTPPIAPIVEPRPKPVPEAEPEPAPTVVPLAEPEAMALAEPGPTAKVEAAPGRRTGLAIAGIVGALAVVIVGAFAVLSGGNSSNKAPISGPTHTEASGPVLIAYPSSWISGSAVAGSSAVGGGSASAAAPVQLVSGKLSLAAGQLKDSAPVPGAVPPALVARYGHPTSESDARVAGANGRQYTWAPAGQRLVAYVVPTAVGDAAIICQAPFAAADLGACTGLAQNAKLSGTQVLPPGPDIAAGTALNQQLAPVIAARSSLRGLRDSNLSARAGRAKRVASAETTAAEAIGAASVPVRYRSLITDLQAALRKEAAEFSALARAASSGQQDAYSSHVGGVSDSSKTLEGATQAFTPTGMRVQVLGTLSLAGPPAPPAAAGSSTPSGSSTPTSPSTSSPPTSSPSSSAPSSPAPSTPAPSTPAPSNPAPSNPAPSNPAPSNPGPSTGGCSGTCTTPFQ